MSGVSPILIPIFAVVGTFVMVIAIRYLINKERMAVIEKGGEIPKTGNSGVLVLAGLMIGGGVGLLLANILENMFRTDEAVYFALIFICGGVGLIFGRKMANKADEK